jgi:hypothetical protein
LNDRLVAAVSSVKQMQRKTRLKMTNSFAKFERAH